MSKTLSLLLVVIISSCSIIKHSNNYGVCDCCNQAYTNIDSAINCISDNPKSNTTSDNRLFLIAFVNKDIRTNQNKGWTIIEDNDIIQEAKQRYLLIIIDSNETDRQSPELTNVIASHKEDLFFVITNQALYPFADWTLNENKEYIIDKLKIGNGP
jgi:hypothetical protein